MTNNQLTSTHLAVKSELDAYKIHASRGQATAMAMVRLFESIDRDLEELQERRQATMNSEPVVPEEMTIRDACKFVQDMRLFDDVSVIVMLTWNACRAAMLAAAPQEVKGE